MDQKITTKIPKLLTKYELSDFLKVHFSTVDTMIKRGLPHYKLTNHYRFDLDEVLEWMKAKNE